MKTKIGLSILAIILGFPLTTLGGTNYQPMESEYYSTLDDHGENLSLAMENADRNMIEYLSCPNVNPNGIRCQIWRNNHLSTLLD